MDSQEYSPRRIEALDGDNWLDPDPVSTSFAQLGSDGVPRPIDSTEWNRHFLAPKLSSRCPEGVMVAFEKARGALIYGWFFYPLYALGQRELLQAGELAVNLRCRDLGIRGRDHNDRLDAIHEVGELSDDEFRSWTHFRKMRNSLVHAEVATIAMPTSAGRTLSRTADLINSLFSQWK